MSIYSRPNFDVSPIQRLLRRRSQYPSCLDAQAAHLIVHVGLLPLQRLDLRLHLVHLLLILVDLRLCVAVQVEIEAILESGSS
jgi:hypothetical protein